VQVSFNTSIAALPYVKSGKLRPLGTTGLRRIDALPGVPTIAEAGVPGYQEEPWQGVLVPAATPRTIVYKLNQDIVRVTRGKDVSDRIADVGGYVIANKPEEFAAALNADIQKYAKLVKVAGIRVE
jgi:tripartite-type tricarboxylate transporter receptor subunit TctC